MIIIIGSSSKKKKKKKNLFIAWRRLELTSVKRVTCMLK